MGEGSRRQVKGRNRLWRRRRIFLMVNDEESELISRITVPPHRVGVDPSFFQDFILKGIRVDRIESGLVVCTFKVPPRLTDRAGNLSTGAIANLVDELGGAVILVERLPMNVSVDMAILFLSTAKLDDVLEITSRDLGQRGGYSGTWFFIRNRATGKVVAEGRHSLFGEHMSKL